MKTITLVLFSLISFFSLSAHAESDPEIIAEIPAPPFSLNDIDGKQTRSLSDFRGLVVYLDFWASWCAPCRKSLPLLNELRNELHDQGFEVIAVNLDEEPEMGLEFLQEYPVDYPVLFDVDGSTPRSYEVRAMPTSFIIDRDGNLKVVHEGFNPADMAKIKQKVIQLLAESSES